MAKKLKKKEKHFTFQSFLRLFIFIIIVYFLINYFSSKQLPKSDFYDPTVLGEETVDKNLNSLYNSIPEKNRQKIENFNTSPVIISIQEKINYLKTQTEDFPQKYIKEAKKALLKNVYENVLNDIENQ